MVKQKQGFNGNYSGLAGRCVIKYGIKKRSQVRGIKQLYNHLDEQQSKALEIQDVVTIIPLLFNLECPFDNHLAL